MCSATDCPNCPLDPHMSAKPGYEHPRGQVATAAAPRDLCGRRGESTYSAPRKRLPAGAQREGVKPTKGARRTLCCPQREFTGVLPSPRAALTLTSDTASGSSVSSFKLKLFLLETWQGEKQVSGGRLSLLPPEPENRILLFLVSL